MLQIAIYSLTRDRLEYTQDCFSSLRNKAGMEFDHYVVDNGSTDSTPSWLKEQEKNGFLKKVIFNDINKGLHVACNQAVCTILQSKIDYDFVIKFDNDCFVQSDDILVRLCDVYDIIFPTKKAFLSPRIQGIVHPPKTCKIIKSNNISLEEVKQLGGIFLMTPLQVYKQFKFNERFPFARGADSALCSFGRQHGYRCFYVSDLVADHYETTYGQNLRYPEYFARKKVEEKLSPKTVKKLNKKFVSVIIPTFDCGPFLKECIDSVLNQTFQDFEIIVVNDGSTDNTIEVLEDYKENSKIRILTNDTNLGSNPSRNKGASEAKGNFFLFVDADSVLYPDMLQAMLQCFDQNVYASYVYCNFDCIGEVNKPHRAAPFSLPRLQRGNFINTMSLIRADHFEKFDPQIKRLQDWDLWITFVRKGKIGVWLNKTLFKLHVRKNGISGSKSSSNLSYVEAVKVIQKKHASFFRQKFGITKTVPQVNKPISNKSISIPRKNTKNTKKKSVINTSQSVNTLNVPMPDRVSLIILTGGDFQKIQRCLDFINIQSYANIETILAVNMSPSKKENFAFHQLRNVRLCLCNGYTAAQSFNKAFTLSSGGYILFLDDNTILRPNAVYELLGNLKDGQKKDPTISIAYGSVEYMVLNKKVATPFSLDNIAKGYVPLCGLFMRNIFSGIPEVDNLFVPHAHWFSLYNQGYRGVCNENIIVATSYDNNPILEKELPKVLKDIAKVPGSLKKNEKSKLQPKDENKPTNVNHTKKIKSLNLLDNFSVDIITCTYNNSDLTLRCFQSIKKFTTCNYTLHWVDNASEPNEIKAVKDFLDESEINYVSYLNNENLGFIKGNNQALEKCTAPYIVMLNNDTRVTANWIEKMYYPFTIDSKAGIVGPVTSTGGSWQGVVNLKKRFPHVFKSLSVHQMENEVAFNRLLEDLYFHKVENISGMVAFFCTMFDKKVFKKCGLLDERFGIGFCDDDDFCLRARRVGFKIYLVCDTYIYHNHRSTFKKIYPNFKQMQRENLNLYKQKHNLSNKKRPVNIVKKSLADRRK